MTSELVGPFTSPTFNRADVARNAALRENINDHISALGDAFEVVRRETLEAAAVLCDRHAAEETSERVSAGRDAAAYHLWAQQSHEEDAVAIRALIDAPETIREEPSRAPDRALLLALAGIFSWWWCKRSTSDAIGQSGLVAWDSKAKCHKLTNLGRAALQLARETTDAG